MLQRAASNAYSWWWASHIRTKQSKWLEQNLQDMGEKVQVVLKLIEEDGDSFAKRAEMYYKKRPELIHFVEESYRAYRALAERYDHISTELQNANNTLAYVFPEQVQFAMEEEEDENSPRFKKPPQGLKGGENIPKVPSIPKQLQGMLATAKKKFEPKKPKKEGAASVPKSGLSKVEGLQEIDRLQKQILALQTEKEFAKSSYEGGLTRYWEIEEQIRELQDKVCRLQDEFGDGILIEDNEARSLMASAALKSCQETLAQLQEKQERSAQEAISEKKRINEARERFRSVKSELLKGQIDEEEQGEDESKKPTAETKCSDKDVAESTEQRQDLESLREKIKEHFEVGLNGSLTMTEMAEKIDELVNKVINLETAVSSQDALIQTLKMETDELQAQIRTLEGDKASLDGKNDLSGKLKEMEQKLQGIRDLNQNILDQNNNLQTHFTEAHCNLDHLSEKLHDVKFDEELQATAPSEGPSTKADTTPEDGAKISQLQIHESKLNPKDGANTSESMKELKVSDSSPKQKGSSKVSLPSDYKEQEAKSNQPDQLKGADEKKRVARETLEITQCQLQTKNDTDVSSENSSDPKLNEKGHKRASSRKLISYLLAEPHAPEEKEDDEPDWKQLYMNAMENKEKALPTEYTTVLKNYKEAKKKLREADKKSEDSNSHFDTMVQLKELKNANVRKDEQIRYLRQKLALLQAGLGEDNESEKSMVAESPTERKIMNDVKEVPINQPEINTVIEDKFRYKIDEVLEENLEFWLRFSTTFQQIQKFNTEVKDLESEFLKIEEKQSKQEGSSTAKYSLRSDAKPLYKHLSEVQTELTIWIEKSTMLKDELKSRFLSLCNIQDDITATLRESAEDDELKFTSFQAAKFQGEILNMKQENNKVEEELQAGLDHVTTLQLDVEKTLVRLNEEFKLSGSKHKQNTNLQHSTSRSRVPLRSFIFGVKPKKQRHSIFHYVHPVIHKKYTGLKSGPL